MPQPTKAEVQAKLRAKFGNRSTRTGGRGSVRRKFKAPSKSSTQDDKRLQAQLKKLNVNPIPAIEEVNLFKDDGTVVHFTKPKVQAEISSNTYVISGNCETKKLEELIPQILPQLGREHINNLKDFASSLTGLGGDVDDDDDVPVLVDENFDAAGVTDEKQDSTNDDQNKENNEDNNDNLNENETNANDDNNTNENEETDNNSNDDNNKEETNQNDNNESSQNNTDNAGTDNQESTLEPDDGQAVNV